MSDKSWVGFPSGRQIVYKPIKTALAMFNESNMFAGCCVAVGCVTEGAPGRMDRVVRMSMTIEHAKKLSADLLAAIKEAEAGKGG